MELNYFPDQLFNKIKLLKISKTSVSMKRGKHLKNCDFILFRSKGDNFWDRKLTLNTFGKFDNNKLLSQYIYACYLKLYTFKLKDQG